MALSDEQLNKVNLWAQEKGIKGACAACGQSKWIVGDIIASPIYSEGGVSIGGPTIPMVQFICENCAYVMLFATVPIGLTE